jgi:hypothetical protein
MYLSKVKRHVDSPWLLALREAQKKEKEDHTQTEAHTAIDEATIRLVRLQL